MNNLKLYLKTGINILQAFLKGPSTSFDDLLKAQKIRFESTANIVSNLTFTTEQILARTQFWCAQTLFLKRLIIENPEIIEEMTQQEINL